MMKLYGPALSNNVFRPLTIARHLGLPVELTAVDVPGGEHKGDAYRALNPHGRVPVLVDGDYALWESLAIVHYLAGQKPSDIYPQSPQARATILSWGVWGQKHLFAVIGPVQFQRVIKKMLGHGDADEAAVAAALAAYAPEAEMLEKRLTDNAGWLVSDGLTVADYDVAGYFLHAQAAALPVHSATAGWLAKVKATPAWEAALKG